MKNGAAPSALHVHWYRLLFRLLEEALAPGDSWAPAPGGDFLQVLLRRPRREVALWLVAPGDGKEDALLGVFCGVAALVL